MLLIAGPTASGKSALALALAERLDITIINADSMQVYRDLRVLTARPSAEEEARVPHRLYGYVDAARNYSAGHWCVDAAGAITEASRVGSFPVVVGGTGLYFKVLTEGLARIPAIPAHVRASIRRLLEVDGLPALYAELVARDPCAARSVMPGDRARVLRALEVLVATGRSIVDWRRDHIRPAIDNESAVKIFITMNRNDLYARIDARFDQMLAAGAVDEVRALQSRNLDPELPVMKAHGVPWLMLYIRGELKLADAIAAAKRDTRRYTKRQATWFRHQLPDWTWVAPDKAEAEIMRALGR